MSVDGLRRVLAGGAPLLTVARGDAHFPLDVTLAAALAAGVDALYDAVDRALRGEPLAEAPVLLAPVDEQEVWAGGVTYRRSATARVEESTVGDVYELVYTARRPELFLKATPRRVPAPGAPLRIRADSGWDVPEPELALVLDAHGAIAGYLVADDVSSRAIEGENPLYLPQAKIYDDALGLSGTIVLARDAPGVRTAEIALEIRRAGERPLRRHDLGGGDAPQLRGARRGALRRAHAPRRRGAADRHRPRAARRGHAARRRPRAHRHRRDRDARARHLQEGVRLAAVALSITVPSKIICVGLNYRDHAEEQGIELPKAPLLFAKWPNTLIGDGEPIVLPAEAKEVDYEAELGVVIGTRARHVDEARALDSVAGYICVNDVSARDLQFADGQWTRGKSPDTFCPVGPRLVPREEIDDPQALAVRCTVNGTVLQDSSTANMIFSVAEIIAYISRTITLEPGDLIATGTPAGVGVFRDPKVLLQDGDEVSVEVEGLGTLTNPVRKES